MRTSWSCVAVTLTLLILQAPTRAATLPIAPSFRLNGHLVHAPAAAANVAVAPALFVTATRASLVCALEADGWRIDGAPQDAGTTQLALAFTPLPHAPEAERATPARIVAWQVGDNPDGAGRIWFVCLLVPRGAGAAHAMARAGADIALRRIFLTGTSRLAVAAPVGRGLKPLAWVRLRHAAGELRLAQVGGDDATCAPEDAGGNAQHQGAPAVAASVASQTTPGGAGQAAAEQDADPAACAAPNAGPPQDAMRAPGPEAGPSCEVHGELPVHPLAAEQVASSVVWHSATRKKQIALTFDACSTFAIGRFNPRVIAALRANDVPATLFVGGHWAEMYPAVLEELAQDPLFELGNHTYSHPHMRDLSPAQQRQELLWTQELIFERTGKVPRLFRPPYGEIDDELITTAAQNGLYTIEYDLPAGDADDHVTQAHLTKWVTGHTSSGSIVVMHMCRPNNHTADALPNIVRHLRAQGYRFCQVSDMLFHDGRGCR